MSTCMWLLEAYFQFNWFEPNHWFSTSCWKCYSTIYASAEVPYYIQTGVSYFKIFSSHIWTTFGYTCKCFHNGSICQRKWIGIMCWNTLILLYGKAFNNIVFLPGIIQDRWFISFKQINKFYMSVGVQGRTSINQ